MKRPRNLNDFVIAKVRYYEPNPGSKIGYNTIFETKYSVSVVTRMTAETYNWDYVELDHPYFERSENV